MPQAIIETSTKNFFYFLNKIIPFQLTVKNKGISDETSIDEVDLPYRRQLLLIRFCLLDLAPFESHLN